MRFPWQAAVLPVSPLLVQCCWPGAPALQILSHKYAWRAYLGNVLLLLLWPAPFITELALVWLLMVHRSKSVSPIPFCRYTTECFVAVTLGMTSHNCCSISSELVGELSENCMDQPGIKGEVLTPAMGTGHLSGFFQGLACSFRKCLLLQSQGEVFTTR